MRLVNGTVDSEGRVEVFHAGQWGTICDDQWDDTDASVVCRSLGYTEGLALRDNDFGEGTGPILLDEVACTGDETSLDQCKHHHWGEHDCHHYEDAAIICN